MNTQDPATGYAYWISPDGSSKVIYALSALHGIDADVNEAFRSIPRGGIETAGLLFGVREGRDVRIEAYRPIQCQHAFGPSFALSEHDLADLRHQISSAASDPELSALRPIGWFVGHTRSPLSMSAREGEWFDEFFPQSGSVAVLVKPERFQPTRFGFLLRNSEGQMERDATERAVILPLQGQGANSDVRVVPSIPAPARVEQKAPGQIPPTLERQEERPVQSGIVHTPERAAVHETQVTAVAPAVPSNSVLSAASIPTKIEIPARHSEQIHPSPRRYEYEVEVPASTRWLRSAAVLVLAALLGCMAGYWAYLRLPSPVIPVTIREQTGQLVVEWPSAQTAGTGSATIRINDGQPVSLTDQQKIVGRAVVLAPGGDVKIDLIVKHWLRDSRGIVRYLRTPKLPAVTVPLQ